MAQELARAQSLVPELRHCTLDILRFVVVQLRSSCTKPPCADREYEGRLGAPTPTPQRRDDSANSDTAETPSLPTSYISRPSPAQPPSLPAFSLQPLRPAPQVPSSPLPTSSPLRPAPLPAPRMPPSAENRRRL